MGLAETFVELFEGRTGSCAIKIVKDGKKLYIPYRDASGKDIPLTADLCLRHLKGEISLGVYPIDQDDMVKWASVDFDGKRGTPLADAIVVKNNLLKKHGILSWLERSQSGNGVHLWIFFDKKISSTKVRAVISTCVPEFNVPIEKRTTSFDRMFPHQDKALGGYGNLCALPLNGPELVTQGKTAFIDEETQQPYTQQKETVAIIKTSINQTHAVEAMYSFLPKEQITKKFLPVLGTIPGGTKLMAPQGCAWLRKAYKNADNLSEPEWYAALCQFAKVEQGDVLAHRFSKPYSGYSFDETQKKFDHAKEENKPPTCEYIWENFGDCGKRCGHLNVSSPWQLAKVPLTKLDEGNKGKIYEGKDLAETGIEIVKEVQDGKRQGVAWGYDLLDDYTELRPRNLVVVAARQGMGKTAVMVDVSIRGAQRDVPQYVFSIEMGYEEIALRYLARLSGIDHTLISTGKLGKPEFKLVMEAADKLKTLPIFIDDSTREFDRMLDNAGELTYKNGRGVIWVDYLQLVRTKGGESKKQAVDRIVDGYKQMSKIIDSPVVTLAQLNRSEEFAEGDDDLDSWLKDSGDIEQTADVIHYIRGTRGPGEIDRRWRLHKERHRASGINFRFRLNQGIFRYEPMGLWNKRAVTDEEIYDYNTPQTDPDGFGKLV